MRFLKNGIGKMRNWGTEKMENWRGEKTKNKNGENLNFVKNATARIVGKSFDFSGKVLKTVFEKNPEKNKKNSKNEEMENRIAKLEKENAELRAKKIAENEEKIEEIKIKIAAAEEFEKMRAEKKARRIELGKEIFDFAAQIFGAVAENFAGKEEIDSEKLLKKFFEGVNADHPEKFSKKELELLVESFFLHNLAICHESQKLQNRIAKLEKENKTENPENEEIDSEKLLQKFAKNSENLKNFSAAELQFFVQHFFENFNSVLAQNQKLQNENEQLKTENSEKDGIIKKLKKINYSKNFKKRKINF